MAFVLLLFNDGPSRIDSEALVHVQRAAKRRGSHGSSADAISLEGQGPVIFEEESNVAAVFDEATGGAGEAVSRRAAKDGEGHSNVLD